MGFSVACGGRVCDSDSGAAATTSSSSSSPLLFSLQQQQGGTCSSRPPVLCTRWGSSCSSSQQHQQHQHQHPRQQPRQQPQHHRSSTRAWPPFASLSANSGIGQLRWNHTAASQDGSSNSSSSKQQQQPAGGGQQRSEQFPGLTQEQVERDVQQLARDVFHSGQRLGGGRYKLLDKIDITLGLAEGRFTTVWHARDLTANREVILKCMEAGDSTSYTSGMREAALHATAGRCSNIVALLDAFEHRSSSGRHPVMVLEPCGTNLLNVIALYNTPVIVVGENAGVVPGIADNPRALKRLAKHTLTALEHLHKRGLVHMDLSPDNVMLDGEFVSQQKLHLGELLPKGNPLKSLSTKWRLLKHAFMTRTGNSDGAARIEQEFVEQMQAIVAREQLRYHEGSLHTATFKLSDFGRAVPYKDLLPGLPAGAADAAAAGGGGSSYSAAEARSVLQTPPRRYNQDGLVVFSDPTYQPPEEILGLPSYISPSYDIWKLGCLLYEAATDSKLFNAGLRDTFRKRGHEHGFSDQHYLLDSMVNVLGNVPRELARKCTAREEFFYGSRHKGAASDMLLIHTGIVKPTPLEVPLAKKVSEHTLLDAAEAKKLADFLSGCLQWDAASRSSAEQLLQHPWLQDDAEPSPRSPT